jgi:hypothetical protein
MYARSFTFSLRLHSALALPTLRQTNWDFGTPRSRYARDELQLMQPEGFPIIPLASTLARAREEAEAEAVVREYSGPDFAIYEDTIEEHDALPEIVVPDTTDNKVIDSRGRTRAASKRLGLDAATAPNDASSEEKENTTQAGTKRKRGGAQVGKQPRKQAKKVTQDAEPV